MIDLFSDYYSSDEDDDFNPYTFSKCKYGYYEGCGYCCRRCDSERKEKQSDEYMREMFNRYIKEQFGEMNIEINLPYKILQININKFNNLNKDNKLKMLKKHYRKLSLKYHPDKGGTNEQFNKLKEAYDIIQLELY